MIVVANEIRNVSIFASTLIHCKLRCMIVLIFTSLILIPLPNEAYNWDFFIDKDECGWYQKLFPWMQN